MDSIEAYIESPPFTTGFMSCLLCHKVQGWITTPLSGKIRAEDFIPAPDYPIDIPVRNDVIECAWCKGPCYPTPTVVSWGAQQDIGWKVPLTVS